jgi:hypothetical protein
MKSSSFWDATSHNPIEDHQLFGRTYCLHLQSRRVCQAINKQRGGIRLFRAVENRELRISASESRMQKICFIRNY